MGKFQRKRCTHLHALADKNPLVLLSASASPIVHNTSLFLYEHILLPLMTYLSRHCCYISL